MNINTQFGIGDEVYFLHSDILYKKPVKQIGVVVNPGYGQEPEEIQILYTFALGINTMDEKVSKHEDQLGKTPEELIKKMRHQ